MKILRILSLAVVAALGLATRLPAQLAWSVYDETTTTAVGNTSDSFSITVPAGKSYTLFATNFVPIDWSSGAAAEAYITINFKASGGLSSIGSGTRAVGFGLYNNKSTASFADDAGYFTWLNGRTTGSLIELRRRNGDGSSPSLLIPTSTAFNSLGTGTSTKTAGSLTDSGNYAIQMHLMSRNPGVSFGSTSSTTTGAGIWVSGDGLSQTAYTNPDNPAAALVFNEVGFMFYNSTTSDVTLTINSITGLTAINPPSVVTQPSAISLNPGQTGALTVAATGTAPISYQWKKDGTAIAGATDATLSLANVTTANAGSYTVTLTNAYGTATSSAAAVTVTSAAIPATITSQPVSQTIAAGSPVSFSVTAYGSSPMTYQWKKDGTAITGATSTSYSIDKVAVTDAGSYTVVVNNATATATSTAATLAVNTAPAITTQPASVTTKEGENVSLSVVASGSPAPTYQWQKNGVNISGANAATLNITGIKLADTGVYTVRIVNSIGAVTSTAAVVAIPSAMTATSFSPAAGATGVNTDTPLYVTFDRAPVAGNSGKISIYNAADNSLVDTLDMGVTPYTRTIGTQTTQFIFYPIIVTGNTAAIYPHAGVLQYGQKYYVTLEQGVVKDSTGASFTGVTSTTAWTFTTKATAPAATATALSVAADGSGDFTTIQGAIDFVPLDNTQRVVITVKKGVYTEINYIGSKKPFITIQGEDRAQTIIQYANNANFNTLTGNNRAMFSCDASDFVLQTITLKNLTPKGGSQAEAFRGNGLRLTLNRVSLYSLQDTFLVNGTNCSAFVTDCYIEGDVDFMWGSGVVYFQRCELKAVNPGMYAQVRNGQTGKGHIYVDCKLTGTAAAAGTFLARIDPTAGNFPYSQVVFINCAMGTHIDPAGWQLNNATTSSTVQFWEYKSTDLAGATLDVSKRLSSSKQIDDATAAQYRDYAYVLNGWVPAIAPTIETAPAAKSVVAGTKVTLEVLANGAPQPSLQWYKDGVAIAGATSSTLVLPNIQVASAGSYTVTATNSGGTVTSSAALLQVAHAKYFGSYFGKLGTAGSFALYLRDDGTGVLLGSESSVGTLIARTVLVDANGAVTGSVSSSRGSALTLAGTINASGALSGTLAGTSSITVSGTRSAATGTAQAYAGCYQISASGSSGSVNLITSATGQAYAVSQLGSVFDAGSGTVDSTGRSVITTSGGQTLTTLISSNAASTLAILNDNKGTQTAFSGTADAATSAQRFRGFSARARCTSGDSVAILGFILTGDTPDNVLIRALGPTLSTLGVSSALSAPKLELFKGGTVIASNTGWTTSGNATDIANAAAAVGAYPLATTSADSAIRMSLAPGAYTAIISSANSTAGVGLVEIYDLSMGAAGQRLADLSVRAPSGSGDNTLIAGVVVSGTASKRMLIRGVGPSLAQFNISGALAKPVLSIYQDGRLIAQNSGISTSADAAAIATATKDCGAFALTAGSADAVLLLNLAPGNYTAQITSSDGSQGIALVELYELP